MRSLAPTLGSLTPESEGQLIVYINGHGVSDSGVPYLLCRNFDPANPTAGRYRLHDCLRKVADRRPR